MRARPVLLIFVVTACTASTAGTTTTISVATTTIPLPAPTTTTTVGAVTTPPPATTTPTLAPDSLTIVTFAVPSGSRPHDVAPAVDGGVWYTAQGSGELGWLDPESGETRHIPLGPGSRPHGVIVDDQGTPWITDSGLNAIVAVDPDTGEVAVFPLSDDAGGANLNTAVFDTAGTLWFTGQSGIYGALDPETGEIQVFDAPGGRGPYGITATPLGDVMFASLAGSYVGAIVEGGDVTVLTPPTPNQGARRVWADSKGAVWVSEWNSGNLSRYDPSTEEWQTWPLPGVDPAAYAVFVDDRDIVWVSDFAANAIIRFDPMTETFNSYQLPHDPGEVRQIHGRPGEVWGAESAADHLVVIRTR